MHEAKLSKSAQWAAIIGTVGIMIALLIGIKVSTPEIDIIKPKNRYKTEGRVVWYEGNTDFERIRDNKYELIPFVVLLSIPDIAYAETGPSLNRSGKFSGSVRIGSTGVQRTLSRGKSWLFFIYAYNEGEIETNRLYSVSQLPSPKMKSKKIRIIQNK